MKRALFASALAALVILATVRPTTAALPVSPCVAGDPDGSKRLAARELAESSCNCAMFLHNPTYAKCVAGVAKLLSSGTNPSLPRACRLSVTRCARRSTCGMKPGAVPCFLNGLCRIRTDDAKCTASGGTPGAANCASCCDAFPPGSGPSCAAPTTTTATTSTTTTTAAPTPSTTSSITTTTQPPTSTTTAAPTTTTTSSATTSTTTTLAPTCNPTGASCTVNGDCCSGICLSTTCQ